MSYCRKCGFKLTGGDLFCPQCGHENKDSGNPDEDYAGAVAPQTVEDSIRLAETLGTKYEALKEIKDELDDCEAQLKRNSHSMRAPRHSAFKFFWPFLIIAGVVIFVITLIFTFIGIASGEEGMVYVGELLGLIGAGITLIAGGSRARNKRDALNSTIADEEYRQKKLVHDLEKRVEELKNKRAALTKAASEYNYLVPISMRSKSRMDMVRDLLESGRAQTFSQAIELFVVPTP